MRTLSLIALSFAALPALAQDSLQRCRAMTDGAARLACYDALADAARVPVPPARAATPAATAAPIRSATAVVAAPVAAPARSGEAAFGLPEARRPDAVESVESSVGPSFGGWGPNSRIRLANGQVWQVIDGTSIALPEGSRKVSVKRGALSSYYLDFEGLKSSPRVRRVE
ncbi:hypothetical protein [Roseateles sp.]|uniref:hypothetical protein n=1 Tax=Roseateles sp. TaxID=1971397 RepID=UPI0039EA2E68